MHIITKKNIIETINTFIVAYKHVPIIKDIADMHISKTIKTKRGIVYLYADFYIKNNTRLMDISLLISVDTITHSFKKSGMLMYKKDLVSFINTIDDVFHRELLNVQ